MGIKLPVALVMLESSAVSTVSFCVWLSRYPIRVALVMGIVILLMTRGYGVVMATVAFFKA